VKYEILNLAVLEFMQPVTQKKIMQPCLTCSQENLKKKREASTSSSRITAAVRQPAFEGPLKSLKR